VITGICFRLFLRILLSTTRNLAISQQTKSQPKADDGTISVNSPNVNFTCRACPSGAAPFCQGAQVLIVGGDRRVVVVVVVVVVVGLRIRFLYCIR
jgi:hypothetical protein